MPIYKGTTELTKIADFLTATDHDITEVYFGDKQVFTVWGKYDGFLPAQYSANGDYLADYRIYGTSGGVGDRTINLWDGIWLQGESSSDESPYYVHTNLIPVENATKIGIKYFGLLSAGASYDVKVAYYAGLSYYEEEFPGELIAQEYFTRLLILPPETTHMKIAISENYHQAITPATASPLLIIDTNTEPTQQDPYVPDGYEVDMSVSDGITATTTPIYIGDEPLGEDEYANYGEGKVYRRTDNQFYGDFINGSLTQNGYIMSDTRIVSENYIKIDVLQNTLSITPQIASLDTIVFYYDNNETYLGNSADNNTGWKSLPFIFSAPNSTKYVRVVFRYHDNSRISPNAVSNVMLNTGETAKTYVPYYAPQDPPVPLPALPTVDGTNIVDYAGQSTAPSRFYAKYRKEGY